MLSKEMGGFHLDNLANILGMSSKETRIFVLQDEDDTTGKLLAKGYSLRQMLAAYPVLQSGVVTSAEDYCYDLVLRVRLDPQETEVDTVGKKGKPKAKK